jgi:putative ATP-dependent endonuclease of OLD family
VKTEYKTRPPPESVAVPTAPQFSDRVAESRDGTCLLVVVEGVNDIEFLRRISTTLHKHDATLPDLATREANGQLVFLPIGGGSVIAWSDRLAPIGCCEIHIYDREMPPETELRQTAIRRIKSRAGCHAVLTRMRSLENYLHPDAILAAGGPRVDFGKDDSVPELAAKNAFEIRHPHVSWNTLSRRTQKRLENLAKRWLNRRAVDCMTPELLRQSDPRGDILMWLATIDALAGWQS